MDQPLDPVPSDSLLDRALVRFFQPRPALEAASSVSAFLSSEGITETVALHEPGDPTEPVLLPLPQGLEPHAAFAGKYQVRGELGRGGVGIVFKGHDPELGRDLALKVLQQRHRGRAELLQRFVAEAQIGGQLQHPGVVPVYELGVQAGLPYFTMKLIQGRTLAALLGERKQVHEQRRRFLQVFEQVCQTVAYAHARGVIHRDLKPSNIMVGAFGEVQVVDWGMAKVLRKGGAADERRLSKGDSVHTVREGPGSTTESVAGDAMGTVAFMPPEQARGEVGALDERSDVFALGGVLCVLLTGEPPYTGDRDEVLRLALRGELGPAHVRLDVAQDDPELIAIAKECLCADLAERPPHAGVVAERVAAYLASLEERAQAARVLAAEERVKAQAARRAQRLTLALAGSILCTLLLGGGGYLWVESARSVRIAETEARIEGQLGRATQQYARAAWSELANTMDGALVLARSGDCGQELQSRVELLAEEMRVAAALARAKSDQAGRDRKFVEQLEEIRGEPESPMMLFNVTSDPARQQFEDNAFRAAFRDYGIEIEADENEVTRALSRSSIPRELAAGLADWADIVLTIPSPEARKRADRLIRIALSVDPDPVRDRFYNQSLSIGKDELRKMAAEDGLDALPPLTVQWLARRLAAASLQDEAHALLRKALMLHPGDFLLNQMLACFLATSGSTESMVYGAVAFALRPDSLNALHTVGNVLEVSEDWKRSEAVFRRALLQGRQQGHMWFHIGFARSHRGDWAGAVEAYRMAVNLDDKDALCHINLAEAYQMTGDEPGATSEVGRAIELAPKDARLQVSRGMILSSFGKQEQAMQAYEAALNLQPTRKQRGELLGNMANMMARKGQLEQALQRYRMSTEHVPDIPEAWINYSIAQNMSNDPVGATASLNKAIALAPMSKRAWSELAISRGHAGDSIGALSACLQAIRLDESEPRLQDMAGRFYVDLDVLELATTHFETATRLIPADSGAWFTLAASLRTRQMHTEARDAFERCVANIKNPSRMGGDYATVAPGFLEEERKAAAREAPFLAIMNDPTSAPQPEQAYEAACCAMRRNRPARAWALFETALRADASLMADPQTGRRYLAARAAAQAGCGLGDDATGTTAGVRNKLRGVALRWLKIEIEAWKGLVKNGDARVRARAMDRLLELGHDRLLDCVHREARLALLGPDESRAWRAFWSDVEKLRKELLDL